MSKKISASIPIDSANPDFKTEIVFIQGKRVEIAKGKTVEVDPIVLETINESNSRYARVVESVDKITPNDEIRTSL